MTLIIYIYFVLASVWKEHALLMCSTYGIEENTSAGKYLLYSLLLKRNKYFVKTLYIVFIIVWEITTS